MNYQKGVKQNINQKLYTMAKIKVELEAFHGYGHGWCSYSSNKTMDVEISDKELESLKKIGKEEISVDDVVAVIENGDSSLESLHDKLSEAFYNMVLGYWLFEAYNEFLYESLGDSIEKDIRNGLYTPEVKEVCADKEEYDDDEYDDDDDCDNEGYDLDRYYEWVKEHDYGFIAERVGVNPEVSDYEENYVISLCE